MVATRSSRARGRRCGGRRRDAAESLGEDVGREVERADARQVLGEALHRECREHGGVDPSVGGEPGRLGLCLGRSQHARRVGPRRRLDLHAGCRGLGLHRLLLGLRGHRDEPRRGLLLGALLGVGALLSHQQLLARGQLDLALQLVLGDGALALDGDGAALVGGLVGILLHPLPHRHLERTLEVGLRADRHDAHADDDDRRLGEPGVAGQARGRDRAHGGHALAEQADEVDRGDVLDGVLLRELGDARAHLLERLAEPPAVVGVDGEVDAAGRDRGVAEPVGDGGLHAHLLEIERARTEDHRELRLGDGHLADGGVERAEPERDSGSAVHDAAPLGVHDVTRGDRPQVSCERKASDVGHDSPIVLSLVLFSAYGHPGRPHARPSSPRRFLGSSLSRPHPRESSVRSRQARPPDHRR
jgi:hypothetical protein